MNDPISWDPSLVKKFSSSNHFKLLNQLRNEVKKYPLNNKKTTSSSKNIESNIDKKNKSILSHSHNQSISSNSNHSNDNASNKLTVNFNNSKNFSIYNPTSSNNIIRQNETLTSDHTKPTEDISSPTFIERLNQVDMK
tara:strand:+ start:117 stop:530 length:414 start_codon:yes stop_codon:yes gene_type:complete